MDIKVLVNALLIIILLHLLIKNFNFNKTLTIFQKNNEYFNLNYSDNLDTDEQNSLNFLLNTNDNDNDNSFNELKDYVQKCDESKVKAGNFYVEDQNTVNFTSNVLNTNKFYNKEYEKLPGSYDGLNVSQLSNIDLNKVNNQSCFANKGVTNTKNDSWNYKNEMIMNGGNLLGNIVGFDTLDGAYASYDNFSNNDGKKYSTQNCNVKSDDIRMGLGYPNESERATR